MNHLHWMSSAIVFALWPGLTPTTLAQNAGTITGKAIFEGNPANYPRLPIPMMGRNFNCGRAIRDNKVILNKKTNPVTIRNVMVYVTKGHEGREYKSPTEPVILEQIECEFKPRVFGIMEGQTLKVRNRDDTHHNIHLLPKMNQEMNFAQPKKGMEQEFVLQAEKTFKVNCDVHPWQHAYVQVYCHPFFDVTGKKGTYELKGLPPGDYEIEAWHETFGTQTMKVTVTTGELTYADFTYEPK